jgi:hypothetical protein
MLTRRRPTLIDDLPRLLHLFITTGQITLNLRDRKVESFETRTYARSRHDTAETQPTRRDAGESSPASLGFSTFVATLPTPGAHTLCRSNQQ